MQLMGFKKLKVVVESRYQYQTKRKSALCGQIPPGAVEIEPIPCGELNNFFGGDWSTPIPDLFRKQLEPTLGSSIESDTPDLFNCAYSRNLEFAPREYEVKRGGGG